MTQEEIDRDNRNFLIQCFIGITAFAAAIYFIFWPAPFEERLADCMTRLEQVERSGRIDRDYSDQCVQDGEMLTAMIGHPDYAAFSALGDDRRAAEQAARAAVEAERRAAERATWAEREAFPSDLNGGDIINDKALAAATQAMREYGCTNSDFRQWSGWTRKAYETGVYWVRCGDRSALRVYWTPQFNSMRAERGS